MRVKIIIRGIVQGVGFRPFTYRTAVKHNLTGYVQNRGDAGVEILLEGDEGEINQFKKDLEETKPSQASIYQIIIQPLEGENKFKVFRIIKSSEEIGLSGSVIPPDIAICDKCLKELRDVKDIRYGYFFVTCTECGPRYSIIKKVPYDRRNTTMSEFQMCEFCESEYKNPTNRRFHAQTVTCPKCGPKVYLTDNHGIMINSRNPVQEVGRLIVEGSIVAIKGYGGFHVAASTLMDAQLKRLREVKHRSQKPFAIMAPSLEAITTFAEISPKEKEFLTSNARPIVLLRKNRSYFLSDLVAPGLHNIGVMLPYSGLHYLLFEGVDCPAFVMTSANPPNQPMVRDDDEALKNLNRIVDFFLFHNRNIAHRCDDSVIRTHSERLVFIRRSRGYAPIPVILKERSKRSVVGLGGELNNTACVLLDEKAFISQHIGDVENIETKEFQREAIERLINLTNSKIEAIACDLHPMFTTMQLAHELAEQNSWQIVKVQHHHAHIAALMAEYGINEIIGICCDGYGYGLDGEAWGGEILLCKKESQDFKRLAHLESQPLVGGDLATRFPLRFAAGMLQKKEDIEDWLLENQKQFAHGEKEVELILHQLKNKDEAIKTTSCGRVLDAVAAVLGICYERTYEGEPSMKLESLALRGNHVFSLKPIISNNTLETTPLLLEIYKSRNIACKTDLALLAHLYLARGLAELALEKANEEGVRTVGFSGGVACNEIITSEIRRIAESYGLRFLVHEAVPPGDGGVSFGQTVIAGFHR